MAIHKPFIVEEVLYGPGGSVSDSQHTGEGFCACSQVRELAYVLVSVPNARLEWIVLQKYKIVY